MPNGISDPLAGQRESLLGEQRKLSQLESDLPSMADKLREALTSRLEHPLMGQRAEAISEFFQTPSRIRQELTTREGVGAHLTPMDVERITAQRRANALVPVTGLTGLIGAELGGIEDVISRGANAFQSLVSAQRGRTELAQTNYNMMLNELVRQAEEAERKRQFEFDVARIAGGEVTLPSGEKVRIPSEVERTLATRKGEGLTPYQQKQLEMAQDEAERQWEKEQKQLTRQGQDADAIAEAMLEAHKQDPNGKQGFVLDIWNSSPSDIRGLAMEKYKQKLQEQTQQPAGPGILERLGRGLRTLFQQR